VEAAACAAAQREVIGRRPHGIARDENGVRGSAPPGAGTPPPTQGRLPGHTQPCCRQVGHGPGRCVWRHCMPRARQPPQRPWTTTISAVWSSIVTFVTLGLRDGTAPLAPRHSILTARNTLSFQGLGAFLSARGGTPWRARRGGAHERTEHSCTVAPVLLAQSHGADPDEHERGRD
jgi:hypothetical protein